MTNPSRSFAAPTAEVLLAQSPWVRRLATSLVGDAARADDLVQDAVLVSLERRRKDRAAADPGPAWFARVLHHLAWKERRGRARREARESRAEARWVPGADELFERATLHRSVVDAVLALREPYRSAILLRYLEEKPPREIARELGVSIHTVNTRLARGLEQLRTTFDERLGGRASWMAGLVAFCREPGGGVPGGASAASAQAATIPAASATGAGGKALFLGALLLNTKLKVGLAAGVVLALAAGLYLRGEDERGDDGASSPTARNTHVDQPVRETPAAGSASDRHEVAQETPATERTEQAEAAASSPSTPDALATGSTDMTWFGRVVDARTGLGVPGAAVALEDVASWRATAGAGGAARAHTTTGTDGHFQLDVPATKPTVVRVRRADYGEDLVGVEGGHEEAGRPQIIALDREGRLTVTVQDERGRARADVTCRVSTEAFRMIDEQALVPLAWKPDPQWSVVTDADGVARFASLPTDVPLSLEAYVAGRFAQGHDRPLTIAPDGSMNVTLVLARNGALSGRLVDQANRAVVGATLWLLRAEEDGPRYLNALDAERVRAKATTDDEGRFTFAGVGTGRFWVGPKPKTPFGAVDDSPSALAPVAQVVRLPQDGESELVLHAHRGLFVRGTVQEGEGPGAIGKPRAQVFATTSAFGGTVMGRTDRAGRFTLGPLIPGAYSVVALWAGARSAPSAARAGDEDVRVVLGATGAIAGKLLLTDERDPRGIIVLVSPVREADAKTGSQAPPIAPMALKFLQLTTQREYERPGLDPGRYDLVAATGTGDVAIQRKIEVEPGRTTDNVDLTFEPGAVLGLTVKGDADWVMLRVRRGNLLVIGENVALNTETRRTVPAGKLSIDVYGPRGERLVRSELELFPGDDLAHAVEIP